MCITPTHFINALVLLKHINELFFNWFKEKKQQKHTYLRVTR